MDFTELLECSYVPYSSNPAAAAVRSAEGRYFPGVRVENVAYPLCISAEQNSLFCCLSENDRPETLWTSRPGDAINSFWEEAMEVATQPLEELNPAHFQFSEVTLNSDIQPQKKLNDLLDQAVVEESDFPVAALLETKDGFISGVNIELGAWNMGLCAERVAIAKALAYGSNHLKKLHVHTRNGEFSSPCGACRQVILEHMPNRRVHLHHADHSKSIHISSDLLPHSFQTSTLSNQ